MANYFSLILVLVTLASGLIWLVDALVFAPKRREALSGVNEAVANVDPDKQVEPEVPYIVDTAQQIFPVIAFVLVLRTFLYEPFQIPSGSMMPTLLVGDFILVEKYAYGLKDPVWRNKLVETGKPERGDVVVFKYPEDTSVDYIKRVIGLPGDTIVYQGEQVFIKPKCADGQSPCPKLQAVPKEFIASGEFVQHMTELQRFSEDLGTVTHDILVNPKLEAHPSNFYKQAGTRPNEWIVPEDQYFVLGDNRDNSRDSRFWGFVKDEHLVGKAVAIWISFEFEREPGSVLPSWIPTGVRFNRVGGIH